MKPAVSELTQPRLSFTTYTRLLMERLARAAKMDWFLEETVGRRTLTGEQVTALSSAFLRENFTTFTDEEIFHLYDVYAHLNFATANMSHEIISYFRNEK